MLDTARGSHCCYVCNNPMIWSANFLGRMVISHGTEVLAEAIVSEKDDSQNQLTLGIHLQCPDCGALNQFRHQHSM